MDNHIKYKVLKQVNARATQHAHALKGTRRLAALVIALQATACSHSHYGVTPTKVGANIIKKIAHWRAGYISKNNPNMYSIRKMDASHFKNHLMQSKLDISRRDEENDLLYLAVDYNKIEKVKCILDCIADAIKSGDAAHYLNRDFQNMLNIKNKRTPLGQAIYLGYKDIVQELLSRDSIDPSKAAADNVSALVLAIQLNKPDMALCICNQLLRKNDCGNIKGINTQEVDDHGRTVLHLAFKQGKSFMPVIELLINQFDQNKNLNKVDNEGYSPLTVALQSEFGNSNLVTDLITTMDRNHLFACGESKQFPLHITAGNKNKSAFTILFNNLCKLHNGDRIEIMNAMFAKDRQSQTVFTQAQKAGNDMFQFVLAKVEPYMQDDDKGSTNNNYLGKLVSEIQENTQPNTKKRKCLKNIILAHNFHGNALAHCSHNTLASPTTAYGHTAVDQLDPSNNRPINVPSTVSPPPPPPLLLKPTISGKQNNEQPNVPSTVAPPPPPPLLPKPTISGKQNNEQPMDAQKKIAIDLTPIISEKSAHGKSGITPEMLQAVQLKKSPKISKKVSTGEALAEAMMKRIEYISGKADSESDSAIEDLYDDSDDSI